MKLNRTPDEYAAKAKELFEQGYNCAQAVLLAFEDVTGFDTKQPPLSPPLSAVVWADCAKSAVQ